MTTAAEAYLAEIEAERSRREARLRGDASWFNVVGLHWLREGTSTVGSAASNDIVLPGGPSHAGVIEVRDGIATLDAHGGTLTVDGRKVDHRLLVPDTEPDTTEVVLGQVRFHAILRAGRLALRVVDLDSAARRAFAGLDYFALDPAWRITGWLEPPTSSELDFPTILGTHQQERLVGTVRFEIGAQSKRLAAISDGDGEGLFLIFGDGTNGIDTYSSGRYLYTGSPAANGTVALDFNLAINPPCAFTHAATCSLPPPANQLAIRVTAGEKAYSGPVAGPPEPPAAPAA